MRVLGLDEAGRGSVLGPLVVGGFLWEGDDQAPLAQLGAADSKTLSHNQRVAIRERLRGVGEGHTRAILPAAIDQGNLNDLEIAAFLELVAALKPTRVYVDAPVHPRAIPRLLADLRARSGVQDWIVEPKADATYPVVGAASIFAKVERDAAITTLGAVGSGYPSDPVTRAHISALLARPEPLPPYVRQKWETITLLRQQRLFG